MKRSIEISPTNTPVRDLPMGLMYDVNQVLKAYGLVVDTPAEHTALMMALASVIDAVATERGGRRVDGRCSWCGDPMPVPERPQGGGRTKLYCSDAHKQAAHRAAREANSGPGDQAT